MDELREVVVTADDTSTVVFSWDGRVLEVFTYVGGDVNHTSSHRYHVAAMQLKVDGPDRKGRYKVRAGHSYSGGSALRVDEEAMIQLRPLLDEVQRAIASP
jgi:hypothetical protein